MFMSSSLIQFLSQADFTKLNVKNLLKVSTDQPPQGIAIDALSENFFDRCHLNPGEPAGRDESKMVHIGGPIERKPMKGYPPPDGEADGRYFLITNPHSSIDGFTTSLNAHIPTDPNKDLLDGEDKAGEILSIIRQRENWITYNLAWTVVSDVSSSFDMNNIDHLSPEDLFGHQDVLLFAPPAQGDDGWMLKEKQRIREVTFHLCRKDPSLEVQRLLIL
jgi:hypothetical protein